MPVPSRFTCPIYTADVGRISYDRPVRVIIKEFDYYVGSLQSDDIITVPIGYCSDGVSIPKYLYFFISPWGKYAQAAILHDLLYSTQARLGNKGRSRKQCDDIFRQAIKDIGRYLDTDNATTPYTKRGNFDAFIAWAAVRLFGRKNYTNGPNNYAKRAQKVRARAIQKKQDKLANQIILTACKLPENIPPQNTAPNKI